MAENLGKQSNGESRPLYNGMDIVPVSEMWNLVIWMHEERLPKIAKAVGAESAEYKNYVCIRDALIWSLYIGSAYEQLLNRYGKQKQMLDYFKQQNASLEKDLLRYATADGLVSSESIDLYRQSIVSKALELLEQKSQQKNKI